MFKISSNLTTSFNSNYSDIATLVKTGNYYRSTLATIGFNTSSQVLPNSHGTPITLSANTQQVLTVVANGVILNPALDPQNPQPGEFVFNPYTNQLTVYSTELTIIIYSTPQEIKFSPSLIRNLPGLFYLLPLEGDIQISRSFENHPQMSFNFETKFSKDTILSIFQPGRQIDIQGVGYRVNNCNCVELPISVHPDGRCRVSISFGGKWENDLDKSVFLRSDGKNNLPTNEPFTDPECLTNNPTNTDNSTSLQTIFSRLNIPLLGKTLKSVPIPDDTPRDAVVSPSQLLQERLRVAKSFVRYSNSQGLEIIDIDGLASHFIPESEIDGEITTDYQAISEPAKTALTPISFNPQQPDLTNFPDTITQPNIQITAELPTNLGFEYPVVELTGDFLNDSETKPENTQGQRPRYVKKPSKFEVRIEGNKDAHLPPAGVNLIQVMSLCSDLGGEQETRTFVHERNGTPIRTVEEIWGFAFTALEIYDASTGKLKGSPTEYWKLLKQVTTEFTYDESLSGEGGTGYLLYKVGKGFNTVRWKTENADSPETLAFRGDTTPETAAERKLYEFFRIPVIEKFSQSLKLMPELNYDGMYELVKKCNRDGTSSLVPVVNPNYAPPYYAETQRTEKISFARRSNPANDGRDIQAGDTFDPDLIVGSLEVYESIITGYTPPEFERKLIGFELGYPVYEYGREIKPAQWFRYNKKFSASGQAIATAIEDISTEIGTGNPPLAEPRRADLFIREEPEQSKEDQQESNEARYRHIIWTDGYTQNDPISGSESFPMARTIEEALTGARTKLAIENWRNGYSETLQLTDYKPQIKEGDLVTYFCKGQYRTRVVISVNHNINILGVVDDQSIAVGKTSLTLGKYVRPNLNYAKFPLPEVDNQQNKPPIIPFVRAVNETLGNLLDWEAVSSRRNP